MKNKMHDALDKAQAVRNTFAEKMQEVTQFLQKIEASGDNSPLLQSLKNDLATLIQEASSLKEGVFKMLILGEFNRGKSTLLNALLGEDISPMAVVPCTAIITKVCYGKEKKATVYFNDGKQPEKLSFEDFKKKYTIEKSRAETLGANREKAFPNIKYALIEYPSPILQKGVEIVDSPGLNEDEEREVITFNFLQEVQAVMFVLAATKQLDKEECTYLREKMQKLWANVENNPKQLPSIFFTINKWDEIRGNVCDEYASEEEQAKQLKEGEEETRDVFVRGLSKELALSQESVKNLWGKRVFETSAKSALSKITHGKSLEGTGIDILSDAVTKFLMEERLSSELMVCLNTYKSSFEKIVNRVNQYLSASKMSIKDFEAKIQQTNQPFNVLYRTQGDIEKYIYQQKFNASQKASQNFVQFFNTLSNEFRTEFDDITRNILLEKVSKSGQEDYAEQLQVEFKIWLERKTKEWSNKEQDAMQHIFRDIMKKLRDSSKEYKEATDSLNKILFSDNKEQFKMKDFYGDMYELDTSMIRSGNISLMNLEDKAGELNMQTFAKGMTFTMIISSLLSTAFHVVLGPIGLLLAGLGIGRWVYNDARTKIKNQIKEGICTQLTSKLPKYATDNKYLIEEKVREMFSPFENFAEEMKNNIHEQKNYLDNLVTERKSKNIDYQAEEQKFTSMLNYLGQKLDELKKLYTSIFNLA